MPINHLELIDDMDFPATRAEIVEWAQEHDGSEEAVEIFRAMRKQYFNTLEEVSKTLLLMGQPDGEDSDDLPSMQD